MKVSVLKLGQIKVFGLSANRVSEKLKIINKYYPHNTAKKRIFKIFLLLVVFFRMDRYFFVPDNELSDFLSNWKKTIDFDFDSLLVRWHTDQNRARCYIFFLDRLGKLKTFAKVVSDGVNKQFILSEKEALKLLSKRSKNFKCPEILSEFEYKTFYMLMVSGVPEGYKHFNQESNDLPEYLLSELQYRPHFLKKTAVEKLSWFVDFNKTCRNVIFINYVDDNLLLRQGMTTTCVHGDFGSENIFYREKLTGKFDYFLIDWERLALPQFEWVI